ncbi:MAG: proline dehydrogenase family protein [Planctomycetota bacterium]
MNLLDRLVAVSLPIIPKPVVGIVSRRYIAGEHLADAVQVVRQLNAEGASATVDVLGEDILEREQAKATVTGSEQAIEAIVEHGLDCNLSVKPTALGLMIDRSFCRDNLTRILEKAAGHGMFVRIDMEDSSTTSEILDLYRDMRKTHENVGVVLQSYLRRSLGDARSLLGDGSLKVRLCKGIYREPPHAAFQTFDVVRRSYIGLLQLLLRSGALVGIATHDESLLYEGIRLVDELRLTAEQYEFQMLLGVIPEMRRQLISEGHRVRVYVPYGKNWYGYSMRRLRENPKVAGHVMRNLLSGGGQ